MRYTTAIKTSTPETIEGVQPGQWINYDGARGRFLAVRNGVVWIAWGRTATHNWPRFVEAYKRGGQRKAA